MASLVHRVDAVVTGDIRAGEDGPESLPPAESDSRRVRHVAGSSRVAVGEQLAGFERRLPVFHENHEAPRYGRTDTDADRVGSERLAGRQRLRRFEDEGAQVVDAVAQGIRSLNRINDDALFGNARIELIGLQTRLHHQVRHAPSDLHGGHAPGRRRLCEADRVQRVDADPASVFRNRGAVEPLDARLRVSGRVCAGRSRHLVIQAHHGVLLIHVVAERVDVGEAGQAVHQFHRPDADPFQHDEA